MGDGRRLFPYRITILNACKPCDIMAYLLLDLHTENITTLKDASMLMCSDMASFYWAIGKFFLLRNDC